MLRRTHQIPREIYLAFNLLALFIITYMVVDTFYRVVNMQLFQTENSKGVAHRDVEFQGEQAMNAPQYEMIVKRNIFGATEKVTPTTTPIEEKVEEVELLEETSLQLSLLGTIAGDSQSSRAIILDHRTGNQGIYKVGDEVQNAVVGEILRGKIVLRHNGKEEKLSMGGGEDVMTAAARYGRKGKRDERVATSFPLTPLFLEKGKQGQRQFKTARGRAGIKSPEGAGKIEVETVALDQKAVQNAMNDINVLMTQMNVRPFIQEGKPEGFIVTQIQPGSIFAEMGLRNGDIIGNVNGKPINTPEAAYQLYNNLQSGKNVSIEITRGGQKRMLTYEIEREVLVAKEEPLENTREPGQVVMTEKPRPQENILSATATEPRRIAPSEGMIEAGESQTAAAASKIQQAESTAGVQAPAAAVIAADITTVEPFVESWADAWRQKNTAVYLSNYSKEFRVPGGMSRAAWEKQRQDRLARPKFIRIDIHDMQKEKVDDSHARVSFIQEYRSDYYSDRVMKTLDLIWENGKWRIAQEMSRPAASKIQQAESTAGVQAPATAAAIADFTTVEPFIESWADAWRQKNTAAYLSNYSREFRIPGGKSRAAWEKQRQERLARPKFIRIDIHDMQIEKVDDSHARASFIQEYRSDYYSDRVMKTLDLIWENREWRIAQEMSRPI